MSEKAKKRSNPERAVPRIAFDPLKVQNPQDRLDAVRAVIEKLGGKMENGWTAFGVADPIN